MGRPPKPLEQRERAGRSPGRDSGGRKLPEVVTQLPSPSDVPDAPTELLSADRATACPFATEVSGGERDGEATCLVCETDLAAETWRRLWTNGKSWLSMQRDRDILLRLCKAYAEEAHLRHALDEDGPFVKGQRGGLVAHPAVSMLRVLEDRITKWEGLCGFNPSDGGRIGVKVGGAGAKSTLEQLLEKRTQGRAARAPARQRSAPAKRAAGSD